jgi:hypothetical protein
MNLFRLGAALSTCLAAGSVAAGPDTYSVLNGNTGSYQYWDESYSGAGCVTCDNAPLSGGTGDLTDGIIATQNWFVTEAPPGNGPYVGWTIDPTFSFHWNATTSLDSVTFHLDDSDGAGGVSAPSSVVVNGMTFAVPEPSGSAPFAFTAQGLSFTGTDLTVSLIRKNSWVFLSEVEFNAVAAPIPEPETYALMLAGLGAVGFAARRRKARSAA